MAETGRGLFEVVLSGLAGSTTGTASSLGKRADTRSFLEELDLVHEFTERTGRPVTFAFVQTRGLDNDGFELARKSILRYIDSGDSLYPQFSVRPTAILSSWGVFHAFQARPTYLAIADLPLAQRIEHLRDPAVKAAILSEADVPTDTTTPMENLHAMIPRALGDAYALGDPPNWEPDPSTSIAAQAETLGRDPMELVYDIMMADGGQGIVLIIATNYVAGDLSLTEEMLRSDQMIIGLGDGGAHVRAICDASSPTYLLAHWTRDRTRGPRLPIELAVKKQSADTARLVGLTDRGELVPGQRADLNVIDYDHLTLHSPRLVNDLPAGGQRFLQNASGYVITMVNGVITRRNDEDTGARPGRLIRSGR
jgi:N-acyl-D-aspartate/D-glutamate deacylase